MRIRVSLSGAVQGEHEVAGEMIVGRSASADLQIQDDEISSRHVVLRPSGERLEVEDLNSTNGTTLDGELKLTPGEPVPFSRGQKLGLGRAVIEIVGTAAEDEPEGFADDDGRTVVVGGAAAQSRLLDIARFKGADPHLVISADHERRTVELQEMEVTVGRDADVAQVQIRHQSVSGRHALIKFENGRFQVRDVDSSNGTFVAGNPVSGWTPLPPHTTVTFGTVDCILVMRAQGAGAEDPFAEGLVAHLAGQGKLTRAEGQAVLGAHREHGTSIAQLLIERGAVTPDQWTELHRQRKAIAAAAGSLSGSRGGGSSGKWIWIVLLLLAAAAVAAFAFFQQKT